MNALVFAKPLSALTLCCWALDEYFAINALTKEHWVSVLTSSRNDEPRNIRLGGNSEVNVGVDPKDVEGVAVGVGPRAVAHDPRRARALARGITGRVLARDGICFPVSLKRLEKIIIYNSLLL